MAGRAADCGINIYSIGAGFRSVCAQGSQRPIGAYLADMLDGLPRDLVQFMLRTAILDRLCAPLCEALAGASSGPEWLGSIEKRQLLLVPLDQEGHWYRYHPLLAEYLSQRLQSELGNEIPGLHQRAALWYASQELWTDAVQHAIAAGDAVRALGLIENCAMPLVKRGDLFTLLGWQRLFPSVLMRSQPKVKLAIAWGMALAIRSDEALELVGELERNVDANHSDAFRSECEAIRSVALALKDHSVDRFCSVRSGNGGGPRARPLEPGEDAQQRGLAAPRGADNRTKATAHDVEADAIESGVNPAPGWKSFG